ncbi:hypothetical protein EPN81_04440 [Patescibacteria group bacterium]|nr:MAG: hypothetical protein EPN81_04440 [Patescibacteria group bacterium]
MKEFSMSGVESQKKVPRKVQTFEMASPPTSIPKTEGRAERRDRLFEQMFQSAQTHLRIEAFLSSIQKSEECTWERFWVQDDLSDLPKPLRKELSTKYRRVIRRYADDTASAMRCEDQFFQMGIESLPARSRETYEDTLGRGIYFKLVKTFPSGSCRGFREGAYFILLCDTQEDFERLNTKRLRCGQSEGVYINEFIWRLSGTWTSWIAIAGPGLRIDQQSMRIHEVQHAKNHLFTGNFEYERWITDRDSYSVSYLDSLKDELFAMVREGLTPQDVLSNIEDYYANYYGNPKKRLLISRLLFGKPIVAGVKSYRERMHDMCQEIQEQMQVFLNFWPPPLEKAGRELMLALLVDTPFPKLAVRLQKCREMLEKKFAPFMETRLRAGMDLFDLKLDTATWPNVYEPLRLSFLDVCAKQAQHVDRFFRFEFGLQLNDDGTHVWKKRQPENHDQIIKELQANKRIFDEVCAELRTNKRGIPFVRALELFSPDTGLEIAKSPDDPAFDSFIDFLKSDKMRQAIAEIAKGWFDQGGCGMDPLLDLLKEAASERGCVIPFLWRNQIENWYPSRRFKGSYERPYREYDTLSGQGEEHRTPFWFTLCKKDDSAHSLKQCVEIGLTIVHGFILSKNSEATKRFRDYGLPEYLLRQPEVLRDWQEQ